MSDLKNLARELLAHNTHSRRKKWWRHRGSEIAEACVCASSRRQSHPANRVPVIIIAVVAAFVIAIGVLIGALVAAKVIKVGSGPSTGAELATEADSTSSSSSLLRPTSTRTSSASSSATATGCPKKSDIPKDAQGTWLDTSSWEDKTGFNCTFTDEMVGGLPIVGLNSTWDDSKQANPNVPPLNQSWGSYSARPIRGVNLGGWFSLEPFITPSIFDGAGTAQDEYTICKNLGSKAAETLEKHYATFYTEDDFRQMAAAGLDHVRIPFSYWAITTYDNDPYVKQISWRYLLRAIEWSRKYGLRVKLDPHGLPGSQNGWNHSGKLGKPDWIIGDNGALNAQRSLDLHNQLSKFFAQPRYKKVVAFYGLVNEPSKDIPMQDLNAWTIKAYDIIKNNGITQTQIFSESMRGLGAWEGQLQGYGDSLAVDVHQYTLFDNALVGLKHVDRISFACKNYRDAMVSSMSGFGPTMAGEWSQADTDCTKYLNGVGMGARWEGRMNNGDGSSPACPTLDQQCSCAVPNADPSTWTPEYKLFLKTFAEAQMSAFEKGWGWFYWTWKTESAPQWSYQAAVDGGFMPKVAYERAFSCDMPIPNFGSLPEFY